MSTMKILQKPHADAEDQFEDPTATAAGQDRGDLCPALCKDRPWPYVCLDIANFVDMLFYRCLTVLLQMSERQNEMTLLWCWKWWHSRYIKKSAAFLSVIGHHILSTYNNDGYTCNVTIHILWIAIFLSVKSYLHPERLKPLWVEAHIMVMECIYSMHWMYLHT